MVVPHTSLLVVAIPGIPTPTMGSDPVALLTGPLGTFTWPDGRTGMANGDVVVIDEAFVSVCDGNLVPADTEGALPSGVSEKLGVTPLPDPASRVKELRRALDARFGGRPGVILSGHSAGIDHDVNGHQIPQTLKSVAAMLDAMYPGQTAVVIRGLGHLLTYEDQ